MENKSIIYCDFDGTVTKEDCVDKFLTLFADKDWLNVEDRWLRGEIGSKECLLQQVNLVPALSRKDLYDFIDSIEIDDYFVEFCGYIKRQGGEITIVSDGFDLFIKEVLRKHGLDYINYFSNTLITDGDKLSLDFKYGNPDCSNNSGVCKCSCAKTDSFYYIGDGLSDVCIAKKAETLFAKKSLKKYCNEAEIDYISFDTFEDILCYFAKKGELNAKLNYVNN